MKPAVISWGLAAAAAAAALPSSPVLGLVILGTFAMLAFNRRAEIKALSAYGEAPPCERPRWLQELLLTVGDVTAYHSHATTVIWAQVGALVIGTLVWLSSGLAGASFAGFIVGAVAGVTARSAGSHLLQLLGERLLAAWIAAAGALLILTTVLAS